MSISFDKKKTSSITVTLPDKILNDVTNITKNLSTLLECDNITKNLILSSIIEDATTNAVFSINDKEYTFEELANYSNDKKFIDTTYKVEE